MSQQRTTNPEKTKELIQKFNDLIKEGETAGLSFFAHLEILTSDEIDCIKTTASGQMQQMTSVEATNILIGLIETVNQ